jgi:hypothetical protein
MTATAFHLYVELIGRSTGKSSVAKAAYNTGAKLTDERTGITYDFTRRSGVEAVLHAQIKGAPEWSRDIGKAWNAVEAVENRKNSQMAKMIDGLSFPHGIDAEARKRMLTDFTREQFGRKGLLWTAAIHAPDKEGDQRNYHAHIMWNERPVSAEGFAKNKDRSATAYADREAALFAMRERWAALSAKQLERAGLPLEAERWRHGHLTLPKQEALAQQRGDMEFVERVAEREPTKHLGRAAVALERKGIETERGDALRDTEQRNEQRQSAAIRLGGLEDVQTLRTLWRSADSATAFLAASQAQGYTVARVTEQDARDSHADAIATTGRDLSRSAPIYSPAELVAYSAQGLGFRLDGATLNDTKASERMEQAAGMKLPTLNEARQAVIDAQPAQHTTPAAPAKRNMAAMARAAFGGLVEFLFGWLGDRTPQQRPASDESWMHELSANKRREDKTSDNKGFDPEIAEVMRRRREERELQEREDMARERGRER